MSRVGRGLLALVVAAAGAAEPSRAQQAPLPDVLLVRCAPTTDVACLTVSLDLDAAVAGRLRSPGGGIDTAWQVRYRRDTAVGALGRRVAGATPRPARILVLVDVSGSMKTQTVAGQRISGIGNAKIALKDYLLRPLDSLSGDAVRVAVAPFGSIDVERRIEAARFVPPAQAMDQVDGLPAPDRENTGLYSAVVFGVRRLEAELREAGTGALGVLVVLTDGNNQVLPGDDFGLLDGPGGLAEAERVVRASAVTPWLIGVGPVDRARLAALAGSAERAQVVELDLFQLRRPLAEARDLLLSVWEVTFLVPTKGREELGRGLTTVAVGHRAANGPLAAAVWRPPVIALPAFSGAIASGVVPAAAVQPTGALSRRVPLLLFVTVLLAMLWLLVPRLLWPRLVPAGAATAKAKTPKAAGGLRTDLKEAPPRRPQDVTASRARPA